ARARRTSCPGRAACRSPRAARGPRACRRGARWLRRILQDWCSEPAPADSCRLSSSLGHAGTKGNRNSRRALATRGLLYVLRGGRASARLFQQQHEVHLDVVANVLGVLPVALADAEVQALELGRALQPGAAVLLLERELDRHLARHVARGQLAGGRELVAAFGGEAVGHVVRPRELLDREQVVALHGLVALAVARVGGRCVDLHVEAAAGEVLRIELDVRGEALERAFELGAALDADESQFACLRLQGPLRGGERYAAAGQSQNEQVRQLRVFAHDGTSARLTDGGCGQGSAT